MEILVTVLAVLGCIAMMGAAMVVLPRVANRVRREPRVGRLIERLRRQSTIDRVLSWVDEEHPDLANATAPDGTVTILFTDIEDSTALNEQLGDGRWLEVLRAHNAIVRDCVREHGGYEVKAQGDGFMIAFPSARRALRCAVAIQRATAAYDEHADAPVRLRIGLHTGEATKEGYDFFGRSVIVAARVANAGRGGEVLVTSLVRELAGGSDEFAFDGGREVELKGLTGSYRVFAADWERGGERMHAARRVGFAAAS